MIGIYKITNTINGKCYIGKSLNIEHRLREHKRNSHSNEHLQNAMKKYGIDNFTFEVLEECTKEEYDERERYWISYYKSRNKEYGYNIMPGGESNPGWNHTKETRQKMSMNHNKSGHHNYNRGKIWINNGNQDKLVYPNELNNYLSNGWDLGATDEFRNTMRKTVSRDKNPFYGKHHSDKTKQMYSEMFSGEKHPQYGMIWITNGSEEVKINPNDIDKYKGYHKGRLPSSSKMRIWVNNGVQNKRIFESELDEFISNGWNKGQHKRKVS